jgi:diguanylate cyclase (GGDEF)-like protein
MKHIQAASPPGTALTVLQPSHFSVELLRLSQEHDGGQAQLSGAVSDNSRFAAQLLRYVHGISTLESARAVSIDDAVNLLGPETVANLALFCSLLGQYRHGKCAHFNYQQFWQKSLALASAARLLAGPRQVDGEKLFTYGLLARLGELALATGQPQEYDSLLRQGLASDQRESAERRLFGVSSGDLSWQLLGGWKLSGQCTEAIRAFWCQGGDGDLSGTKTETCRILTLAALLTRICFMEFPLTETFAWAEREAEQLALSPEQVGRFFDRLVVAWQTTSEVFDVARVHCPGYHQIKTIDEAAVRIDQHKLPPLTFLAVDDDPMTIIYLKKMLTSSNRVILTADNGAQALALALEHRPQILITDWRMPKLDGIELCRVLRKTKATQHMYIIMLTGNETDDELVQAFAAGADDYVVKPFTPKVLQARISSGERLVRQQQTIQRDRETIQRYATKLANANRKLQNMAMTDFLTELPNRRNALLRLRNLVAQAKRYGEPLSCLMIDIDHFKKINDGYGHDYGDFVLQQFSSLLAEKARSYDIVSRWGGEEFLIISARSGPADARRLAERLRQTVEQHQICFADGAKLRATVSIGVATWSADMDNEDELLKEADTCLYLAKTNGRNRVESSTANINGAEPR